MWDTTKFLQVVVCIFLPKRRKNNGRILKIFSIPVSTIFSLKICSDFIKKWADTSSSPALEYKFLSGGEGQSPPAWAHCFMQR